MIYLNNASTTYPKPDNVIRAVESYLKSVPFHNLRTGLERYKEDKIFLCRKLLAKLFNVKNPEYIIFTSGATESLNLAIFGLNFKESHVITTSIEHNSVIRPLKTLELHGLIELTIVECDSKGYISPQKICEKIKKNTKAIIVNHCSNVTGFVMNLEEIGKVTRERGITFIVDASQSAGIIPIDVQSMNIDLLAFTGHKSLYGMQGVGGLFIRENIKLKPLKIGGTGVKSDYLYQPESMPIYYEAGTQNIPGIVSLHAGVSFIFETGLEKIRSHKEKCVEKIITHLEKKDEIILYLPPKELGTPTIFSFNIKNISPEDVGYILDNSFDIIVRSGLHCAPLIHKGLGTYPLGSVRVSPSYFTTDKEIELFLEAIDIICQNSVL